MTVRSRRSLALASGVRLNCGLRGIGVSVGGHGVHVGRYASASPQRLAAGVGVPLPVVSKRLGHTDIYTSARIYAHALASDESAAAEKWEAAMQRAENSKVIEMPLKKKQA